MLSPDSVWVLKVVALLLLNMHVCVAFLSVKTSFELFIEVAPISILLHINVKVKSY